LLCAYLSPTPLQLLPATICERKLLRHSPTPLELLPATLYGVLRMALGVPRGHLRRAHRRAGRADRIANEGARSMSALGHKRPPDRDLARVRFTPQSGRTSAISARPLSADFVAEVAEEESGPWRRATNLACHSPVRAAAGNYSSDCQRAFCVTLRSPHPCGRGGRRPGPRRCPTPEGLRQ